MQHTSSGFRRCKYSTYSVSYASIELVGGVLATGLDRLDAAAETVTPQVVSVGALDMVNFGPRDSVPPEFERRQFHVHNPQVTLMRTTGDENIELCEIIARKLNDATEPTALALPLDGVSLFDVEGKDFHDAEADAALFDALRSHVDDVDMIKSKRTINDDAFAERIAATLDEYMHNAGVSPGE